MKHRARKGPLCFNPSSELGAGFLSRVQRVTSWGTGAAEREMGSACDPHGGVLVEDGDHTSSPSGSTRAVRLVSRTQHIGRIASPALPVVSASMRQSRAWIAGTDSTSPLGQIFLKVARSWSPAYHAVGLRLLLKMKQEDPVWENHKVISVSIGKLI